MQLPYDTVRLKLRKFTIKAAPDINYHVQNDIGQTQHMCVTKQKIKYVHHISQHLHIQLSILRVKKESHSWGSVSTFIVLGRRLHRPDLIENNGALFIETIPEGSLPNDVLEEQRVSVIIFK